MAEAKYRSIARHLRERCAALPEGAQLPPERELSERYGVSPMTVRQALGLLEDEGLVDRVFGRGTYVQRRIIAKGNAASSFSDDMRARGMEPSARLLGVEFVSASETVAKDLRIKIGERVLMIERLRFADADPMCIETAHIPGRVAQQIADKDLDGSLHELLDRHGVHIATGVRRTRAIVLDDRAARMLQQPDGAPALLVAHTFSAERGVPVQRAESIYRADRYELYSTVRRTTTPGGIP